MVSSRGQPRDPRKHVTLLGLWSAYCHCGEGRGFRGGTPGGKAGFCDSLLQNIHSGILAIVLLTRWPVGLVFIVGLVINKGCSLHQGFLCPYKLVLDQSWIAIAATFINIHAFLCANIEHYWGNTWISLTSNIPAIITAAPTPWPKTKHPYPSCCLQPCRAILLYPMSNRW